MEQFFERDCCVRDYKEVWEAAVGEALVCERVAKKCLRSIRYGCEKRRNYHRTFALKAVAGVFNAWKFSRFA